MSSVVIFCSQEYGTYTCTCMYYIVLLIYTLYVCDCTCTIRAVCTNVLILLSYVPPESSIAQSREEWRNT